MSTKQRQSKKLVPNVSGDEDDVGVLIYRESQLRKAEAAAAAESEKTSTASTQLGRDRLLTTRTTKRRLIRKSKIL